jgi:hypothetical protein
MSFGAENPSEIFLTSRLNFLYRGCAPRSETRSFRLRPAPIQPTDVQFATPEPELRPQLELSRFTIELGNFIEPMLKM